MYGQGESHKPPEPLDPTTIAAMAVNGPYVPQASRTGTAGDWHAGRAADHPELRDVVSMQGRVTARIMASVAVRPVITLYELEHELLLAENARTFADLGLGASVYHLPLVRRLFQVSPASPDPRTSQSPPPVTSAQFVQFLVEDDEAASLVSSGADAGVMVDAFARTRGYARGRACGIHISNFDAFITLLHQERAKFDALRQQLHARLQASLLPSEARLHHVVPAIEAAVRRLHPPAGQRTHSGVEVRLRADLGVSRGGLAVRSLEPDVVATSCAQTQASLEGHGGSGTAFPPKLAAASPAPSATAVQPSTPSVAALGGRRRGRVTQQPVAVSLAVPAAARPASHSITQETVVQDAPSATGAVPAAAVSQHPPAQGCPATPHHDAHRTMNDAQADEASRSSEAVRAVKQLITDVAAGLSTVASQHPLLVRREGVWSFEMPSPASPVPLRHFGLAQFRSFPIIHACYNAESDADVSRALQRAYPDACVVTLPVTVSLRPLSDGGFDVQSSVLDALLSEEAALEEAPVTGSRTATALASGLQQLLCTIPDDGWLWRPDGTATSVCRAVQSASMFKMRSDDGRIMRMPAQAIASFDHESGKVETFASALHGPLLLRTPMATISDPSLGDQLPALLRRLRLPATPCLKRCAAAVLQRLEGLIDPLASQVSAKGATTAPFVVLQSPKAGRDNESCNATMETLALILTEFTMVLEAKVERDGKLAEDDATAVRSILNAPMVPVTVSDLITHVFGRSAKSPADAMQDAQIHGFAVSASLLHTTTSAQVTAGDGAGVWPRSSAGHRSMTSMRKLVQLVASDNTLPNPTKQWLTAVGMMAVCARLGAGSRWPVHTVWQRALPVAPDTVVPAILKAATVFFAAADEEEPRNTGQLRHDPSLLTFVDTLPFGLWLPCSGYAGFVKILEGTTPCSRRAFELPRLNVYAAGPSVIADRFANLTSPDHAVIVAAPVMTPEGAVVADGAALLRALTNAVGMPSFEESLVTLVSFDALARDDSTGIQVQLAAITPWVEALLMSRFPKYYAAVADRVAPKLESLRVTVCESPAVSFTLPVIPAAAGGASSLDVRIGDSKGAYVAAQNTLFIARRSLAPAHIAGLAASLFCPEYNAGAADAVHALVSHALASQDIAGVVANELRGLSTLFRLFARDVAGPEGVAGLLASASPRGQDGPKWHVPQPVRSGNFHNTFPPGTSLMTTVPRLPRGATEPAPRPDPALIQREKDVRDKRRREVQAEAALLAMRPAQPEQQPAEAPPVSTVPAPAPRNRYQRPGSAAAATPAAFAVPLSAAQNATSPSALVEASVVSADDTVVDAADGGSVSKVQVPAAILGTSFADRTDSGKISFGRDHQARIRGDTAVFDADALRGQESEQYSRAAEQFVCRLLAAGPPPRALAAYERRTVTWMNERNESGQPYDVMDSIVDSRTGRPIERHFIEVKATTTADKHTFELSLRELLFAAEHGRRFSVYRVYRAKQLLTANGSPKVTKLTDPIALWRSGRLTLKADIEALITSRTD